ncbi:MAG: hypothetical protein MO847_00845 [Candidatus Protistobacter heckmanni]|nr:hypothetical protein [Candidatus Protistobacter heckmanni]
MLDSDFPQNYKFSDINGSISQRAKAGRVRTPVSVDGDVMARDPFGLFASPAIEIERRPDGALLLHSPVVLPPPARCIGEYLEH